MESLLKSLNNLPAMSAGMYSRFTVILYQLVKQYYKEIDAQIVSTKEGIAVLAINSFIINPYVGITLDYSAGGVDRGSFTEGVDYFLETEIPKSKEVLSYIKDFSKILESIANAIPLTVENVANYQSRFHTSSLAVDVYPPHRAEVNSKKGKWKHQWSHRLGRYDLVPSLMKGSDEPTVFETKFYLPRNTGGLEYSVEIVRCNESLVVELEDTPCEAQGGSQSEAQGGAQSEAQGGTHEEAPCVAHFVIDGSPTPNGFYKPGCNLEAIPAILEHGDFAAGGLFMCGNTPQNIRYKVLAKGDKPVTLNTECPVFTMGLKIDGLTVHPLTDAEETNVDIPLQK